MMTMREKLIEAASGTADFDWGTGEMGSAAITNWPDVIDAILTTLREPDEDMKDAAYMRLKRRRNKSERPEYAAFTAMVDHIRSGK